jgi:hypothetical protein
MASTEVFVVETASGEVLLGHLLFGPETVTVLSGFVGRPVVLHQDEVESIVPAATHPDVEGNEPVELDPAAFADPFAGQSW